jgi:hypothetical protein
MVFYRSWELKLEKISDFQTFSQKKIIKQYSKNTITVGSGKATKLKNAGA